MLISRNFILKRLPFLVLGLLLFSNDFANGSAIPMAEEWTWRLDGSRIFNFLILVAAVGWLIKKFAIPMLKHRQNEISKRVELLIEQERDAATKLSTLQEKMALLAEDCKRQKEAARLEGEAIKKMLIEEGAAEAKTILAKAKIAIALETKQARDGLINETLNDAIIRAEAMIVEKFDDSNQDELIKEYLSQLKSGSV
ncbi:MAG: hypothetical protein ACN4E2_04620 [Nitrospinota bacterium]